MYIYIYIYIYIYGYNVYIKTPMHKNITSNIKKVTQQCFQRPVFSEFCLGAKFSLPEAKFSVPEAKFSENSLPTKVLKTLVVENTVG